VDFGDLTVQQTPAWVNPQSLRFVEASVVEIANPL
jgi:hypothetical protein